MRCDSSVQFKSEVTTRFMQGERLSMDSTTKNSREELVALALKVSENAVAQHSNFHVGAALETAQGEVFTGCNVESDSYGLTICAERVALTKALSEGEREFTRIAIVGIQCDKNGNPITEDDEWYCGEPNQTGLGPCGACRQLLWDHCRDIEVIGATPEGEVGKVWQLAELLPDAFNYEKKT
uniref:Cytidine deaminase (Cdd) n=1 Tax=uncultured marine group II/III euryarchaeote KM3_83_B05 TaxID=1456520 RepID=A0A075HQ31_9EURY|nr:cytidine deaminase (cdd) [uncultured marine group II/III euryarchaeote KM3_83_B05]